MAALAAVLACACSFDQSGLDGLDGAAPDAPPGGPADATGDAEPTRPDASATAQPHLLLTEIATTTPEFIEILNPGTAPVPLDHYYLSDDDDSARLPALYGTGMTPALSQFDFIVKFPDDAVIGPGQVIVVALSEIDFIASFQTAPDYALAATSSVAMSPILVGSSPTITDSGEGIALIYWDGASDLVRDVDLVDAGHGSTNTNRLANKTDLMVDGPDQDQLESVYLDDVYSISGTARDAIAGESYKRLRPEDGFEDASGGNGLTGHDETSEDMVSTWSQDDFTAPTPGQVPPGLLP